MSQASPQELLDPASEGLAPIPGLGTYTAERTHYGLPAWMGRAKRIVTDVNTRRGVLCLSDQAVVSVANFFTTIILGRMCYQEELGLYAVGFTLVIMLMSVLESLLWTPYTMYSPHMAGKKLARYTGSVTMHAVTVCFFVTVGLTVLGRITAFAPRNSQLAALFGVLPVAAAFMLLRQHVRRVCLARMDIAKLLVADGIVSAVQIGGLLLLAYWGCLSAITAFTTIVVACGAVVVLWAFSMRDQMRIGRQRAWHDLGRNWAIARWTLWAAMISAAHAGSYHWILTYLRGPAAVGVFAAVLGIIYLINPLLIGISNFYGPFAARTLAQSGSHGLRKVTLWGTLGLLAVIVPFCAIVSMWGGELVALLYGPTFSGQGHLVRVMAFCQLSDAAGIPIGIALVAIGRAEFALITAALKLVVALTLGVWCIQHFGLVGAGYVGLATSIGANALQWFAFRRIGCNT